MYDNWRTRITDRTARIVTLDPYYILQIACVPANNNMFVCLSTNNRVHHKRK